LVGRLHFTWTQLSGYTTYVVDAAIKFWMPKEEAQHTDLMAYLRAVTIELTRLKALGVQGIGANNTIDFTVKQAKRVCQPHCVEEQT
jgi:hypothetical protein